MLEGFDRFHAAPAPKSEADGAPSSEQFWAAIGKTF